MTHPGVQQRSGYEALGAPVFAGPVRQEIYAGTRLEGEPLATTMVDRIDFAPQGAAPANGIGAENYSIRFSGDLVVPKQKSYRFLAHADDGVRVFVDGKLILSDWSDHPPRITAGEVALEAGKHRIVVEYYQGVLGAICQFGFEEQGGGTLFGADGLRSTLTDADAVVVAVGFGQHTREGSLGTPFDPFWPPPWARAAGVVEAEDDDRPFQLPRAQLETIALATAANPRTVVIGFAGGGVNFEPWLAKVPALLWAWYPGQEGGTALADVLTGKESPSGRLPVTFAKRYSDHPSASSYHLRAAMGPETTGREPLLDLCPSAVPSPSATSASGAAPSPLATSASGAAPSLPPTSPRKSPGLLFLTPYCEGLLTGYRGFDHYQIKPLFPFGFGMTYTHFSYDAIEARRDPEGTLSATVTVTNRGSRKGRAVVQIYVAPRATLAAQAEPRAPQQLAGHAVVELEPSGSQDVRVPLATRAFSVYRPGRGWVLLAGDYELRASSSSRDHHQKTVLTLEEAWESSAPRHFSAGDLPSGP